MLKKWISWINLGIGSLSMALLVLAAFMALMRPSQVVNADLSTNKRALPPGTFAMPKQACDAIGRGCLALNFSPITLQLPDLRNHLIYYGKNGRPDAKADRSIMHFAFTGNPNVTPVVAGEKLYLLYDRSKATPQYVFSQENVPTSLWIEAATQNNEAIVNVYMKGENGEIIREPSAYAELHLPEKESVRVGGKPWEMGKWRVDGSLLARQKASWKGQDRFFERHGGEEFRALQAKHRIDFTDEEETYSVYVGVNDSLIWDNNRWKLVQPGEESLRSPLLLVKKIDERIMNFELWDVGGKSKMIINLVKMNESWSPERLQESFKCLGARTRSQYIFEIDGQRILLSPKDWLLQTEEGWITLSSPEEIDDYVLRKRTGVLFVFDGMVRKEGRQVLTGVVFNESRTEMKEIELPVQKGSRSLMADNREKVPNDDEDEEESDD